jgi:hypothetical protein
MRTIKMIDGLLDRSQGAVNALLRDRVLNSEKAAYSVSASA